MSARFRFAQIWLASVILAGGVCAATPTPSPPPNAAPTPSPKSSPTVSPSPKASLRPAAKPANKPKPKVTAKPKPKATTKPKPSPAPSKTPEKKAETKKPAAPQKATPGLPPILQEVEKKYGEASTLTADFTQVNESVTMKTKKKSSGVILFKRPDKIRWETYSPDKSLLISDGKRFWFYTPPFEEGENGQVIERKSSEIKSKLAHALLSGSFSAARDMKIESLPNSEFKLIPKPGTAGTVSEARILIDPEKKLIQKVTLEHQDGNRSEITLDRIELGKPLGEQLFFFEAPPNTDRITQ